MVCKRKGSQVATGYFAQDHKDGIPLGISIIEWLHDCDPTASQEEYGACSGRCYSVVMMPSSVRMLSRVGKLPGLSFAV